MAIVRIDVEYYTRLGGKAYRRFRGEPGEAPLTEMYGYIKKKRVEGRLMTLDEYPLGYLSWTHNYAGQHPALLLAEGLSTTGAAANKVQEAMASQEP